MGRHRIPFPVQYLDVPVDPALIRNAEIEASSAKLRALVAPKKKASKSRALSKPTIENAVATADEMRIAKDYRRASALHMVALWAWAHEVTYGVLPSMSNSEWKLASIVAGSLLKKRFDGKAELLVDFVQWVWLEEGKSVKWKKENKKTISPLGWKWQFSEKLVDKWRTNGGGA